MARTNRFASTTADVQARMARVGRIERVTDRDAIRQSMAEVFDTDVDSIVHDDAHVYTYSTQTPASFEHVSPFAGLAHGFETVRDMVHNDVLAIGERYEYERACAEYDAANGGATIEMWVYPLTLAEATKRANERVARLNRNGFAAMA